MPTTKFAVTPGFEQGGSLFKPEQLAALGAIVGSDAKIELTTFKQLYVEMDEERAEEAKQQLRDAGLLLYPAGFYTKSLIACNFCKGAEEAGLDIANALNDAIAGIAAPSPLKVGYAGCALGTSEPLLKDIGVVKMKDTYDIYVGGEPKSLKAAVGTLFLSGITADRLIPVVRKLIDYYCEHGKKKEKFARFIDRISIETLRSAV
ncbi:nitrite reductase [Paenibacillus sp. NPDC056579]|uniref:nitrite reductase n=1 Tax=unclassified Paenibacillus TaxID=185978 RepID=UPI001EF8B318|nr:nitrite reductase [Paenibacillus sp. H1-7]ULL14079.1 nitrite reductase [Paenibacillus sp. H1-7]